ncbi:trehalose-phosphatase [Rhizorhapis sp. SPR117]|uniref:trehalose-phosphatase n=1 Tax=Rhizorhapis sp. SPR117 TaxID=2912611 RepID=UPI001F00BD63|nr:trehalose-phosphatase [Rhizorhapis sp. SPR117]
MTDQADHILAAPPQNLLDGASLFLDFDGTLVELADRPENVSVSDNLHQLLHDVRQMLEGRLAIVSGRSVATLRREFGLGDFLLSGSHGLEHASPDQPVQAPPRPSEIELVLDRLSAFASGKTGLLVEEKSLGAALHFRLAPEREAECLELCRQLARETGLYLQYGKMLFELRPGSGGKGSAVVHLLEQTELGTGRPVFIGDDITDEAGFIATAQQGGSGILVGPHRQTAAHYRLMDVTAVHVWLSQYCAQNITGNRISEGDR